MKKSAIICALASASLLGSPAHAEGWAAGAKAGTLGFGAEIYKSFGPVVNGRLALNAFSFDDTGTEDDVTYDYDVELNTMGVMVDWHLFRGAFRVTGGVLANGNEVSLTGKALGDFIIGDTPYTPEQVGNLTGTVDFDSTAPYLGIGWGNPVAMGNRLSFNVDLGVLFTGAPAVALAADGALASDPDFQANLKREEQNLEDDLSDLELHPVIAVGVTYQF